MADDALTRAPQNERWLTLAIPPGIETGVASNRERISDIALRLFAARGYEGVGVQEIVTAVGVTKPTLYHYFGSKKGLLHSLLEERLEPFTDRLRAAAETEDDLPLALNRSTRAFFQFSAANPELYRLLLALGSAPAESEAAQVFAPFAKSWSDLLEALFAAASNPRVRTRASQLAATFLGMTNTWIALGLQGRATLDEELTFQAVHQFMHGIYA
ncbi:MAG TPA: TetR/AcrR family transcriptional regulator [Myxococcales bacterium]|nr:TetR/AcrR family transcriptional regulator [Myxococcales bacterium]